MPLLPVRFFRKFRLKYGLLALVVFLMAIGVAVRSIAPKDANAIYLAVAAPLTGKQVVAGQEMVQSIQLYLDSVNQAGGINGHPLKLLAFDDRGDVNSASRLPQQVNNSAAVVVLGHLDSALAVAAAPLYKALQIPAITGTASEDYLTQANPYYFCTIFNNSV